MQRALCVSLVVLAVGACAALCFGAPVPRRASLNIAAASDDIAPGPQPLAPATNAETHPLTVLLQFQLDGVSPAVQRSVVELVNRGIKALGEAVHLPGEAPAPLLLPRSCAKVREWARRDGGVTSECIEVRAAATRHTVVSNPRDEASALIMLRALLSADLNAYS